MAIDDVTERKRAETMLKSAKWHAERANLSKSRFLAAASHDLRQPLQTLSLVRGILAKKIKDKKDEEALMLVARLNETADALLGMLDTLLDINQLETGGVRPERVDFPINDLLERLRIEFAFHAQAHGLIWHVVPCRLSVRSDPRLLEQMIRNLLSNAVKHTEHGKILLGCRRRGDKLRIQVWDTGTGIPRDQLRAIFEEFHQLDNPVREHNRGFGLGLSIVQRLGNLLGHSIDVQSRIGKGSVFAVEVPLGGEQPSLPGRRRSSGVQSSGRHARILVVEADPSVREMLALLFTSEGHRTAAVADGKQAVALARGTIKPDIVVADYSLPNGMTGLQVIARVRKTLGSELPAVILTDDISTDTMREITQRGCVQRYKPVRAEELTHLIQSLLVESRQPTMRADPSPQAGPQGDMLRPTIFVVDDESPVREAMRELLQEEGWEVEVYSSGEAFLEAYRPGREGCLVVDARMPRMSGLELLEQLKVEDGSLPAIMITASCRHPTGSSSDEGRCNGFSRKAGAVRRTDRQHRAGTGTHAKFGSAFLVAGGGRKADRRPDLARAPGRRNGRRRQSEQADRLRPRHQPKNRRDPSRNRHEKAWCADAFRADPPDNRRLDARPVKIDA